MTGRCHHVCRCGSELTCGDADRCAVGAFWSCPTCEQDEVERFIAQLVSELEEKESQPYEPQQPDRQHAEPRQPLV